MNHGLSTNTGVRVHRIINANFPQIHMKMDKQLQTCKMSYAYKNNTDTRMEIIPSM